VSGTIVGAEKVAVYSVYVGSPSLVEVLIWSRSFPSRMVIEKA